MVTKKTTSKKGTKNTNNNSGKIVAGVIGVAALSVAAYLLAGPEGKKNRKVARAWMLKMKAEVAEKVEDMKEVTADTYSNIVESVATKYSKLKHINADDLEKEVSSLKKEWSKMVKSNKKTPKKK